MRYDDSLLSGYSADKEEAYLPPLLIDLQSKQKITDKEALTKRRKLSERDYLALTVKAHMKRDGQECPSLLITQPRVNPTLSFAGVRQIQSSSVASSPFLIPQCTVDDSISGNDNRINTTDDEKAYVDFIIDTSCVYNNSELDNSEGDNTSSVISSISEIDDDANDDIAFSGYDFFQIRNNSFFSKASFIIEQSLSMREAMAVGDASR